jgi:predicted Zn finger-like uncharacterized protein
MIVQCNACQAKFKIADEKVTPKGVKVRCTRCKNMFVVRKPEAEADPFPDDVTRPLVVVPDHRRSTIEDEFDAPTRVGIYAAGVAATRISAPATPAPLPPGDGSGGGALDGSMADPFAIPGTDDPFGGPAAARAPAAAFQVTAPAPEFRVTAPESENAASPDVNDVFKDLAAPEDNAGPAAAPPIAAAGEDGDGSYDRSAFDMGLQETPAAPSNNGLIDLPNDPGAETASHDSETRPAPLFPTPSQRMRSAGSPVSTEDRPAKPQKKTPRPKTSLAAAAANAFFLLVAAVGALISVAVYANDGVFDAAALNPATLINRIRGTQAKNGLVVSEVTNGLYETVSGRPVFYVRGLVTQFTAGQAAPVRVTVEISRPDGAPRVGHGFAGAIPSPEQIFRIAQAEDLANLDRDLAKTAPALAKDKSTAFAVVFYDYPDDFSDARLKIHAESQVPPGPGG